MRRAAAARPGEGRSSVAREVGAPPRGSGLEQPAGAVRQDVVTLEGPVAGALQPGGPGVVGAPVASAPGNSEPLPGVAGQLLEVLSAPRLSAGGTCTVRVALHPSALGEVRATVSAGRGALSVGLEASTADGLEAIRRSLPELHETLAASGGRAVVSVSEAGSKEATRMSGGRLEGWGQLIGSGPARSAPARSGPARNESTGERSAGDGWAGEHPSSDGHAPHHGGHGTSGHGAPGHADLGQPGDRRRPATTAPARAAATGPSRAASRAEKGDMAAPHRAPREAGGAGAAGAGSPTPNLVADGATPAHLVDVHV